jgi:hypothetical protein
MRAAVTITKGGTEDAHRRLTMKANQIKVGGVYIAKVNNKLQKVSVDEIRLVTTYRAGKLSDTTVYDVTNLATGRKTTFRSAAKFREEVKVGTVSKDEYKNTTHYEMLSDEDKKTYDEQVRQQREGVKPNFPVPADGLDTNVTSANQEPQTSEDENSRPFPTLADGAVVSVKETSAPTTAPAVTTTKSFDQSEVAKQTSHTDKVPMTILTRTMVVKSADEILKGDPGILAEMRQIYDRNGPQDTGLKCPPPPLTPKQQENMRKSMSDFASRFQQLSQPKTSGVPHVEVRALAGTGKTTTAIEGMASVKGINPLIVPSYQQLEVWKQMELGKHDTIRFCAFGNAIAEVMKVKLADRGLTKLGCEASTLHSLGFAAFRKAFGYRKPSSWAVLDLVAKVLGGDRRDLMKEKGMPVVFKATDELVSLCKQNLAEPTEENLDKLASHYDVELNGSRGKVYDLVPQVLELCKDPKLGCEISFDDMVWLPVVLGLPIWQSDVLIVDESQDLNRMQQQLAYKAGKRIIYVGDPHQAIFGFAGADAESMHRMGEELNERGGLVTLPLTVTRRCGRRIVKEAQRYVPEYEAHESNPDGIVRDMKYPDRKDSNVPELPWEQTYAADVRPGNMVLCRCNAPLVTQCFKFIKRRIKANILGRKIGDGLVSLVNKMQAQSVPDLVGKLSDWYKAEVEKEQAKRNPSETKLQGIEDRHDCVIAFTEEVSSVDGIVRSIQEVFTDDAKTPGVKFSSIHKAKGLEAHRVFYLQPPGVGPREDKMQDWEVEQEENLRYVATTRAIEELVYVT